MNESLQRMKWDSSIWANRFAILTRKQERIAIKSLHKVRENHIINIVMRQRWWFIQLLLCDNFIILYYDHLNLFK